MVRFSLVLGTTFSSLMPEAETRVLLLSCGGLVSVSSILIIGNTSHSISLMNTITLFLFSIGKAIALNERD